MELSGMSLRRSERLKRKRDESHLGRITLDHGTAEPVKRARVRASKERAYTTGSTSTKTTSDSAGPSKKAPAVLDGRNSRRHHKAFKLTRQAGSPPTGNIADLAEHDPRNERLKRSRSDEDDNGNQAGISAGNIETRAAKRLRRDADSRHSGKTGRAEQANAHITPVATIINTKCFKTTIYSLPPELLRLIAEELWDNTTDECSWNDTLCGCALTCSSWRAAVRPLIYRSIVIRDSIHIQTLAQQILTEPNIASWIRKIRFEGKSIPKSSFLLGTEQSSVKQDVDTWMYSFFSDIGVDLPNVKSLDLFGFYHLSLRRDDLEAFARWIPQLGSLGSVESLHLARCEMPPNALTAIIRAFPKLRNVAFTCVSFWSSNGAELAAVSEPPLLGSDHLGGCSNNSCDDAMKYPVLHKPPRLHSFSVDNYLSDYSSFTFTRLQDWLCPARLTDSLQYLHAGGDMVWRTFTKFIVDLGPSPALHTLRMSIELIEEERISQGLDISNLVNLKYFIADCPIAHPYMDVNMVQCLCQLFAQINIPELEEATVRVSLSDELEYLKELDRFLCGEKFQRLKRLNVSVADYSEEEENWDAVDIAKSIFPNMEAKGLLRVVEAPPKPQMP